MQSIIDFIQNSPILSAIIVLLAGMFPVGDTSLFGMVMKWLADKLKKTSENQPIPASSDELVAVSVAGTAKMEQVARLMAVADHATRFGNKDLAAKVRALIPEVIELEAR